MGLTKGLIDSARVIMKRKLAAILAADVVGYSRLMEWDETGTLVALKAIRKELLIPLISEHQGRIFKLMGDGVLVEFASAVNAGALRRRCAKGHGSAECRCCGSQSHITAGWDQPWRRGGRG